MAPMIRGRSGVVLLEVLVALTLLTVSGLSILAVTSSAMDTQRQIAERERELVNAERVLAAHSLLTRQDLDLRLGERDVGAFTVTVQRPEPALYRISIAAANAPDIEALVTVVYRPPSP